ncbi:MAG: hypothetical protein MJ231_05035, partial [bacterium]|nr:hypothetical protein [bacterium]
MTSQRRASFNKLTFTLMPAMDSCAKAVIHYPAFMSFMSDVMSALILELERRIYILTCCSNAI